MLGLLNGEQPKPIVNARLIAVSSLAIHDGAAILSYAIANFNIDTGIVSQIDLICPMLEEQEQDSRVVDINTVSAVLLRQKTRTKYLSSSHLAENMEVTCNHAANHLQANIFAKVNEHVELFFFESWRSFPVILSFYNQYKAESWNLYYPNQVLDVESYLRDIIPQGIDSKEALFLACNDIANTYRMQVMQNLTNIPLIMEGENDPA